MTFPDDYLIPGVEPYHVEPAGIIYNADCRDILPHLPKVDLVLTDPPYGIDFTKYNSHEDDRVLYEKLMRNVIDSCIPRSKACLFYQSPVRWADWNNWIPNNAQFVYLLKKFAPIKTGIVPSTDVVMWWVNDKIEWGDTGTIRRNWYLCPDSSDTGQIKGHPCPRPISGVKYLLKAFGQDIILDPFLGSGTTAVAAKELGRKFIGIEISEEYCAIAVKRLRQGVLDFN